MPMFVKDSVETAPELVEDTASTSEVYSAFTFFQHPEFVSPIVLLVAILLGVFIGSCAVAEAVRGGHPWVGFVPAVKMLVSGKF
jgi:hypothetical protein